MINKLFSPLQRLGKAFMLPIAILPAAGLLLGIGGALSNPQSLEAYPLLNVGFLQAIFSIMAAAGTIIFANLALLFAVGVTVGLVKSDKGTAALAAVVSFLVMNTTMGAILALRGSLVEDNLSAAGQGMVLGIQTLETGVFGGVIVGVITAVLHGRYNKIVLPQALGFFGGSRFVPIISAFTAMGVAAVMVVVWPPLQNAISGAGAIVTATGYIGTFFMECF